MTDDGPAALEVVQRIESILAEMLESYANLREKYIHGDRGDFHSLSGPDRDIALEVAGIRQAAHLIRGHRDPDSELGLPVHVWGLWWEWEREYSARLSGESQ